MTRQQQILGALLLATLLAAYFAPDPESSVVAPVARSAGSRVLPPTGGDARPSQRQAVDVLAILPRLPADADQEPFAVVSWEPPAPPAAAKLQEAELPPPPPQAPPLPFKVMGQYQEGGQQGVFLLLNDRSLVAKVGDVLADQYQVESYRDGVLTLVYLPLQQRQTLVVSAAN